MVLKEDILALIRNNLSIRDLYGKLNLRRYDRFSLSRSRPNAYLSLYEFLAELYGDMDILLGPDGPFPIGVLGLEEVSKDNPNNILGNLISTAPKKYLLENDVIKTFKKKGSKIWEGKTFSLNSLSINRNGKVGHIEGCLGSFFNMVSSAGYLELECLAAMEDLKGPILLQDLPARELILSQFSGPRDCLFSGGGIDSIMAISPLVIYKRGGEYWVLWDVLPKSKNNNLELYHAIPALIFQPVVESVQGSYKDEWDIKENIFREYLEELFAYPEAHEIGGHIPPNYFHKHPNLIFLKQLIADGKAELRGVNVVFNFINHRSEICVLLLIKDESWHETQVAPTKNTEGGLNPFPIIRDFKDGVDERGIHPQYITTLPLKDPLWEDIVKPWNWVPPGAAALIFGAKEASSLLGIEEPEWLQKFRIRKSS